ncbi:hypothetical protein GCM10009741_72120 [Kribbella lupini]|uniref:Uncharacterized protein n=1 Tax=Kribbella lupini TaxID=291602 RepID=A0ABP4N7J9_9ACTN
MQVEQLVLDGAVVQLEGAGAQQDAPDEAPADQPPRRRRSATMTSPITTANQPKAWKSPSDTKPAAGVDRS